MGNVHVSTVGSDCLILLENLYWGLLQLHAEYYALRISFILLPGVYTALNGIISSGLKLGMMEPLHWLIQE